LATLNYFRKAENKFYWKNQLNALHIFEVQWEVRKWVEKLKMVSRWIDQPALLIQTKLSLWSLDLKKHVYSLK